MPAWTAARPLELALAVWFLRAIREWTQQELAEASGVHQSQISLYETGRRTPSRETLARLAAGARFPLPVLDRLIAVFRSALPAADLGLSSEPPEDEAEVGAEIGRAVSAALRVFAGDLRLAGGAATSREWVTAERSSAPDRWARLQAFAPEERRFLVENAEEYRSFALCELICEESTEAAPKDAARALELAELALYIAERVEGSEGWRARLRGYASAFVGNARRVGNDLSGADGVFERSKELWAEGAAADPGVLDASRVLDLEASLLRDRRRFRRALALLGSALAMGLGARRTVQILLKKSSICEQMGDREGTIEALRQAAPLVDGEGEPRLLWVHRFNFAVNLCHLGRHAEAAPLVAEARELATALRNEIDLLRVLWLEARVASGLGRRREAIAVLRQVREDFAGRGMVYDAALAALDLTVLLLDENEHSEVRTLAGEMMTVFERLGAHREAMAAARIFSQAVGSIAEPSR